MLSLHLMDCLSRKKLNHFLFPPLIWKAWAFCRNLLLLSGNQTKVCERTIWRFMHMHRDTAVAPCLMCLWKSSQSNLTKEPIAAPSSESPPSVLQLRQEKKTEQCTEKKKLLWAILRFSEMGLGGDLKTQNRKRWLNVNHTLMALLINRPSRWEMLQSYPGVALLAFC